MPTTPTSEREQPATQGRSSESRRENVAFAANVAMIFAAAVIVAAVVWSTFVRTPIQPPTTLHTRASEPPVQPLPTEPISIDGAALKGDRTARVVMLEYFDFQCPYCKTFEQQIEPTLERNYVDTGKVLLAVRQFPLPKHPFAQKAAEAAECAERQDKFWPMQKALFQHQQQLDEPSLRQWANEAGVTAATFRRCLSGEAVEKVQQDAASGQSLRVTGTPTFFVGLRQADGRVTVTRRLPGAGSVPAFSAVLDGLLRETTTVRK
jgi:protein-disulfide isomerase